VSIIIRFEHIPNAHDGRRSSVVHTWPACPRVGDYVEIRDIGQPEGTNTLLQGQVTYVGWGEDGNAVVRYR